MRRMIDVSTKTRTIHYPTETKRQERERRLRQIVFSATSCSMLRSMMKGLREEHCDIGDDNSTGKDHGRIDWKHSDPEELMAKELE